MQVGHKSRMNGTSKPTVSRNGRPGDDHHEHGATAGFNLDLTHGAEDHHDTDFVKY
jgi:hypothetical protein